MNYKDLLIDSQRSAVSAYTKFILEFHDFDKVVACFVEGQDYSYYRPRVENNADSDSEVLFYPCNGKKEVELVKQMIEKNLIEKNNVKELYFCDSDYGINPKVDGIFYTDFYSVENYYTSELFIHNVIEKVFNINKHDPEYSLCIDMYKERYEKYYEQTKKLNAYCYGLRLKERELSHPRTDLNCISFNIFFTNSDFENYSFKNLDFDYIKSLVNSDIEITEQDYKDYIEIIDERMLRGKWELKFVEWFLDGLRIQKKNGTCGLSKNNRGIISFQNEIMTSMEKYALTTINLDNYICDMI